MAINARVVGTLSKDLNLEQVELLLRSIYKGINKLIDSEYANFGELFKSRGYPNDCDKTQKLSMNVLSLMQLSVVE
jgi:hypothetical protein